MRLLRSDNAKEYMSATFQTYVAQQDILHQSSCVNTPAQNGVAERKNHHLLETARALLFERKVPKDWADAVSTACFLINRIPTTVLNGDIPIQCYFLASHYFPYHHASLGVLAMYAMFGRLLLNWIPKH